VARARSLISIVAVLTAAAALLPAQAFPSRAGASSLPPLESAVLLELNQIRIAHGLVPLKVSQKLSVAATQHCAEMLADGYFAHGSADGSAFWKRVAHYYGSASYGYWAVGENLLWSGSSLDATHALVLWMASPEHRANILTPRWREVGISAMQELNAPGAFDGFTVTLVTTDFGVRH
jgi:uncharacterized protein YkwD